MIYLIAGNDVLVTNKRIETIIKDEIGTPDAFNVERYDCREASFDEIIESIMLLPLGIAKKAVVLDFAHYFEKSSKAKEENSEEKQLFNILQENLPEIVVIFVVRGTSIDKKIPLFQLIEEKGQVYIASDISERDWPIFIKRYFEKQGAKISKDAIDELITRIGIDSLAFVSEADKILLYTKDITVDVIKELVTEPFEEKQYELTNALVNEEKGRALKIYRDFMVLNVQPVGLITMLANQFRLYSQIFILSEKGLGQSEIAETLKIHTYRVKLALDMRAKITLEEIFDKLEKLHDLDFKIKSGQIDGAYGLELFIINY